MNEHSYPIIIGSDILNLTGDYIQTHYPVNRVAVITDETVKSLYADVVMASLRNADITATLHTIKPGEESKSWQMLNQLHTEMISSKLRRDSLIVALGGGVVGDLAGFAASTYLRGLPFIQIPTTLLAQVDSSVGGKTGINHPMGKNLVGSFHQPRLVLIDAMTLRTLDTRDFWSGMAEVIKYGIIWDSILFDDIVAHIDEISTLEDTDRLCDMIAHCCEIKAEVVRQDEKETGLRRILNFGHTIGHAIEAVTDYNTFKHGEAVIYGMRWAAWVSWQKELIGPHDYSKIETCLQKIPVPPLPSHIDAALLDKKTQLDKKQTDSGLQLVLLNDIGKTVIKTENDLLGLIEGWLHEIRS